MNNIGNKIRLLREEKNLTMNQLAELSGVAQSSISLIEQGKRKPNGETLRRLATALEISIDELMDGEMDEASRSNRESKEKVLTGLILKSGITDVILGVATELSEKVSEDDTDKIKWHEWQSKFIKEEVLSFFKDHREEIIDRFVSRIKKEIEKKNQMDIEFEAATIIEK